MMLGDHFDALLAPERGDVFAAAVQRICTEAGAERFLVIKLQGLLKREIAQVVHGDGIQPAALFRDDAHPVLAKLVAQLQGAPGMSMFLGQGEGETMLGFDGFEHGCAALARGERHGCIVVFARSASAVPDAERVGLISTAVLSAQMILAGFVAAPPDACPLRDRELECLRYYMAGFGPKQTGQALGISARTVEGHLDRARLRCNVENTLAAAVRALNEGWIDSSEVRALEAAA